MLRCPAADRPATSARDAAAAFVRGATRGFGRRELAEWLMCHYATCVIPSDAEPDTERSPAGGPVNVDESSVARVVRRARIAAERLLDELADPHRATSIARLMIATGEVATVRDERGAVAWAPVDLPRMRLHHRVASLLVADYLNAPFEYRDVRVCHGCGAIGFGGRDAHAEGDACDRPRRHSDLAGCEVEPNEAKPVSA